MIAKTLAALALGLGVVLAAGCGPTAQTAKVEKKDDDHDDHDHGAGPHGGTIIEFGGGKYHGEFTVDHDKKEATVYILKKDAKTAAPVGAGKLTLSITNADPKFTVDLLPKDKGADGKAAAFAGTHPGFGKHQEFSGTVSWDADGKPYAGDFAEKPEKK